MRTFKNDRLAPDSNRFDHLQRVRETLKDQLIPAAFVDVRIPLIVGVEKTGQQI